MSLVNDVTFIVDVVAVFVNIILGSCDFLNTTKVQSCFLSRNLDTHWIALTVIVTETTNDSSTTFHDLTDHNFHFQSHASVLDRVVTIGFVLYEWLDIDNGLSTIGK